MSDGSMTDDAEVVGWTAAQIREAERPLLDAGVPLMRRAARGLAGILRELRPSSVLLLAGSGDNGGDGLFAVAELAAEGTPVRIAATGSRLREDALAAAIDAGATRDDTAPADLAPTLRDGELILDAMVGTGSTGAGLRGAALDAVRTLLPALGHRTERHRVVAVDVPSGIGVDDGAVPENGAVLPAEVTVSFGGLKAGTLLAPASALCGEVRLIDIGLGPSLAAMEPAVRRPRPAVRDR